MIAGKMNHFFYQMKGHPTLFNSKINGIDESDLCILIGTDIKKEAPVLSSRIRQRFLNYEKSYQIFRIGSNNKTVFKTIDLGIDSSSLSKLKDKKFTEILKSQKNQLFILRSRCNVR